MLEFIIFVLYLSLVLYVIFAGADFGAGIYELLCLISKRTSRKELIEKAIGPIWEANHIWLILVVVISFMGFPEVFSQISTYLHIPIAFILIGITLRGTAFAFRHYDPYQDQWQKMYSWLFGISSVWTSFWQGVTAAALLKPFPKNPTTFFDAYLAPWFSPFNFAVGVFVVAVYLFLAQTFFLGEPTVEKLKKSLYNDFYKSLGFVLVSGFIVFIVAEIEPVPFNEHFFDSPLSIACMVTATLLLAPLIWSHLKAKTNISRILVGAQVSLIFTAVIFKRYPLMLSYQDGSSITYAGTAAPDATIRQLFYALVIGITLVLPFLIYLYRVFKSSKHESP